MVKERDGHISPLEKLKIRFDGYFDGIINEIEAEILVVGKWPQNIRLGHKVKRKEQELEWLNRLKDGMQIARAYINLSIEENK